MPAIVDFPTVVQKALALFGDLFDTEPARRHFAEYLTDASWPTTRRSVASTGSLPSRRRRDVRVALSHGWRIATRRDPALLFNHLVESSGKQPWETQTGRLR